MTKDGVLIVNHDEDVKGYDKSGNEVKLVISETDFSDENIEEIRSSGCMLAAISLNEDNAKEAFRHHPDMAEYPHTSDFEKIEKELFKVN